MPWEKSFDRDAALDAAIRVFREKGYDATTYADIVAATKASRYGLYDEFGDKRALFLRALDRYRETVIGGYVGRLADEDAGADAIRAYFEKLIAVTDHPEVRFGCLMVTAAMELAVEDEDIRAKIHEYFDWLTGLFQRAMTNAAARHEVPAGLQPKAAAVFLNGLVQGGAVFVRAGLDKKTIATYLRTGLRGVLGDATAPREG